MGTVNTEDLSNLYQLKEFSAMEVEGRSHGEENQAAGMKQNDLQSIKFKSSENLLKSKNIVERFLKPNEGEKKKSTRMLKTLSYNPFKSQRSKRLSTQWDKAKPLLLTPDLNNPPLPQNNAMGRFGELVLENKPPDLIIIREQVMNRKEGIPSMMNLNKGIVVSKERRDLSPSRH